MHAYGVGFFFSFFFLTLYICHISPQSPRQVQKKNLYYLTHQALIHEPRERGGVAHIDQRKYRASVTYSTLTST